MYAVVYKSTLYLKSQQNSANIPFKLAIFFSVHYLLTERVSMSSAFLATVCADWNCPMCKLSSRDNILDNNMCTPNNAVAKGQTKNTNHLWSYDT